MPTPQETERRAKRRTTIRTTMSCDRCKLRKTKCVDPVPGPCQFCASIGAACHLDPSRRRQRPYYRVSEEEFRYMTQIIEHFLPNTELNLQSLKAFVDSLDSNSTENPLTPSASDAISPSYALISPHPAAEEASGEGLLINDELSELYSEVGKIRFDSRGIQRHVGPSSAYLFHSAVRSIKYRQPNTPKTEILAPLTASQTVPPPTPESSLGVKRTPRQVNLPQRELCHRCISRFFRDVHSVYWLFSAEQLYATLDRIYAGDAAAATPATLCGLYSILAITCESEMQKEWSDTSMRPSVTYLTLAKAVVPALYDDADSDSIRALCLLSLALSCSMFGNTAYIYTGAAARIAFTLGWHVRDDFTSRLDLQEQVDLRLFCTLYLLDLDTSLCYGNPPAIDEGTIINTPKAPSEQLLGPGTNMPLDYLEISCQLAYQRRCLTKLMYQKPTDSPSISIGAISKAISGLENWYTDIPSHLRHPSQVARFHERSVAVLHLRYWSAIIYATRPFLLYSAMHYKELDQNLKQKWFAEFSAKCVAAAQTSLEMILFLKERNLLSSLVVFDCGCILENMQVFLLALRLGEPLVHKRNVEVCLHTLQNMEQVFWPRHALPEVTAQLQECGILNSEHELNLTTDQSPGLVFLDFAQQGEPAFFPDFHIPDLQEMIAMGDDSINCAFGPGT